jgi:hypothetical protein
LTWINNSWNQVASLLVADSLAHGFLGNNLFLQGQLRLEGSSGYFLAQNNLFDQTALYAAPTIALDLSHNGYITGFPLWRILTPGDILLDSAPVYASGPLGYHYYPAGNTMLGQLQDAGSRPAHELGLAHFTISSDQRREDSSPVDIGFHYVACVERQPTDTDQDGLADYLEDANGNRIRDGQETDFQLADTDQDGMGDFRELLQGRTPTRGGIVPDTTGHLHLEVYTPLEESSENQF